MDQISGRAGPMLRLRSARSALVIPHASSVVPLCLSAAALCVSLVSEWRLRSFRRDRGINKRRTKTRPGSLTGAEIRCGPLPEQDENDGGL